MTEAAWLSCDDPEQMLCALKVVSDARSWRLFAAACCRAAWPLITDERSRRVVEATEQFVDGELAEEAWLAAGLDAVRAQEALAAGPPWACAYLCAPPLSLGGWDNMPQAVVRNLIHGSERREKNLKRAQAALLRDVFNPFLRSKASVALTPAIASLARAAYEERALPSGELESDRLAVLSDALEEAGCSDERILAHLRDKVPHVRGCWALDLVLTIR